MAITIDEAFEQIGSMGCYQIRLLAIFVFCAFSVVGFQALLITFIAAEPGWKCADNSTACNLTGVHRPASKHYNFRCDLDRSDWEFTDDYTSAVTQAARRFGRGVCGSACWGGFRGRVYAFLLFELLTLFDDPISLRNLGMWNLVCKDSILQSVSSSSIFAGWLLGAIILSWISDKTGRRKVAYFGALGVVVAALLSAASPYFWMFVLCRAIVGFFVGGTTLSQFVLVTEFVGVRHRNVAGTILWFAWTCSFMATSLIAYFIRDWRVLTIVISLTGIPFVFSWWFIPESVHWLLVKHRVTEAEEIIRKMAAFNKKTGTLPNESLVVPSGRRNTASFLDLFRGKKMTHFTIVFWTAWAVNSMVYYGVSLSSQTLDGNMYLNFFLTSIIEIPANAAAIYCMKRFGRKKSTVMPMILASLASIGTVLLMSYPDDQGLAVGCIMTAMIAKFFIMISFDSIYVYSAELFPTVIRSVGMGTSSAAGRMGSFLSPYVVWLKRIHTILPYGIMGGAALIAGFLCMSLPETKDQPMPDVIDSTSTGEELLERESKDKLNGTADQHDSLVKLSPECRKLSSGRENVV